MKKSPLLTIFYILIGVFLVIISMLFVPLINESVNGPITLLPFILFSLLGGYLLLLTKKSKIKGTQKKLLMLTGVSALAFFIGILLHNVFYGIAIVTGHIPALKHIFEFLHAAFFIIAMLVSPLGYLVGTIGSIVFFIKTKK